MISTIVTYFNDYTRNSYNILNENNIFNFIITTFDMLNDEQKEKYINNIKLLIGNKFYQDIRLYIFKKSTENSNLLKYFK